MSAVIKNASGEDRDIPLAGGLVKAGDKFEVDDELFWHLGWPESLYEVVQKPPASSKPASADEPPARNAKREVWAEYAVALGADPAVVEDLDRDQLIAQFGDGEDN